MSMMSVVVMFLYTLDYTYQSASVKNKGMRLYGRGAHTNSLIIHLVHPLNMYSIRFSTQAEMFSWSFFFYGQTR